MLFKVLFRYSKVLLPSSSFVTRSLCSPYVAGEVAVVTELGEVSICNAGESKKREVEVKGASGCGSISFGSHSRHLLILSSGSLCSIDSRNIKVSVTRRSREGQIELADVQDLWDMVHYVRRDVSCGTWSIMLEEMLVGGHGPLC